MRVAAVFVCIFVLAGSAGLSYAQDPNSCEALSSADPASSTVSPDAVVAACAAALAANPGDSKLVVAYAAALERAGRLEDALRMYRWAADDGYAPAIEAVKRLADATTQTSSTPDWSTERTELGQSMTGIASAMRRLEGTLPADPSDPLTIIAEIGNDPATITDWVAAHTRLVPYAGSLRGPRGVLSDRSGNSLDRALALAALLASAGEDVRLARTSLDDAHAKALLEASRTATAAPPSLQVPTAEEMLATLRASGVAEDVAKTAIDQTREARQRADAIVAEQTAVLLPLLQQATAGTAAATAAMLEQRSIEQLKDHFWVQVQQGSSWVDHDPDAATVGPLTATETLAADAVPDALRHAVTVRVIVEIQAPSGRREETLVSWTGFTATQGGDTLVTLSHTSDTLDGIEQVVSSGASPKQLLAAVDATSNWTPLLWVNGKVFVEKLFTRDGQVRTADANALTKVGHGNTKVFEEAVDVLGDETKAPVEVGVPTAEWIEIELTAPGESPRVERRTLFDLLGPAQRADNVVAVPSADQLRDRTLRLAGHSDILILGANPSRVQLARSTTANVAEAADNVQAVAMQPEPPELVGLPQGPELAWPLRQFARERLSPADAPAISAPNVFMYHQMFRWTPAAAVADRTEIDIVFNDVTVPNNTLAARVRQGVADSILEGALMKGATSTANDTVLDLAAGKNWTLVMPGDEQRLASVDPDLRARIRSALADGSMALVPLDGSARGWWKIDSTGTVLAIRANGGGSAGVEAATLFYNGMMYGACFVAIGVAIGGGWSARSAGVACLAFGGTGALAGLAVGVAPAAYVGLGVAGLGGGLAATGGP